MSLRRTALALAGTLVLACSTSAPSRFYTLQSTATPAAAPAGRYAVVVGAV